MWIAMSRMVPRSSLLRNGDDLDGRYRNIRSVSRCPVHPGRLLRVLHGPGSRRARGADPRTHAGHLADGGRAHHGRRHMVDALRRHARLRAADADVLRYRLDRPFPHAGDLDHERRLLRHQSPGHIAPPPRPRSEEHTSALQSLMRISYAVFYLN